MASNSSKSLASTDETNTESRPVKRKRGRPPKISHPTVFAEPGTPTLNCADPQSLITSVALPQPIADCNEDAPIEMDAVGETKVTPTGHLSGGREYSLKTFTIMGHGEKLFMLATQVARLTGYRDSNLFFLRNRKLRKVVTTQTERNDLFRREAIPFSYRHRHISVVTARSVFIQFGHRVILNGQRIRDDYYEKRAALQEELLLPITEVQRKATTAITNRDNQNPGMSYLQPCRRKSSRTYPTMEDNPPLSDYFPNIYRKINALRSGCYTIIYP